MLEGIKDMASTEVKNKNKNKEGNAYHSEQVPRTQGFFLLFETFIFYSLFLLIFPVRKKIQEIIKSQTQQKLIKQR